MPLFRDGCLIGAVATDGETETLEERAAWAGAAGFRPDDTINGNLIFIDGIALPFVENKPPNISPIPPYGSLAGTELVAPMNAPPPQVFPLGIFGNITCQIRYPLIDAPGADPNRLLAADITAMFDAAVARSVLVRAAIRRPLGTAMRCFIAVVDLDGNVLGCIRTPDATLFSFDVAIQKARTAAFFSADTGAFTTRGIGFLAQAFFPPGIDSAPIGPLNGLQDALSANCAPLALPLANGITIFPGGIPLYRNGVLIGAIGVSGDGVDQDDFIATAGAELFAPPNGVRADELSEADALAELDASLDKILAVAVDPGISDAATNAKARLAQDGLQGIRMPYVKFPRRPFR